MFTSSSLAGLVVSLSLFTATTLALAEAPPVVVARVASTADAMPSTDAVTPLASPSSRPEGEFLDVVGHAGAVGSSGYSGGLLGASVLARQGMLAFGGTFDASSTMVASRFAGGLVAGWSYRQAGGLGLDLLGVGGVHRYAGIGRALLSNDPGVEATMPFVGARGRVGYQLGQGSTRFQLGMSISLEQDLGRERKVSSYEEVLGGSITSEHTVGFTTAALTLDAGMTFR